MRPDSESSDFKAPALEAPGGADKILLHCCCAPCACAIIEALLASGIKPALFYYNPNIYPLSEYERRRDECARHAQSLGLEQFYADAEWEHGAWLEKVRGLEAEPERGARCLACFKMRLAETARQAVASGFGVFATTLTSSRWKDSKQIALAGGFAQALYPGAVFWDVCWRKGGLQLRRDLLVKKFGFYLQQYCGCEFSFNKNKEGHNDA